MMVFCSKFLKSWVFCGLLGFKGGAKAKF